MTYPRALRYVGGITVNSAILRMDIVRSGNHNGMRKIARPIVFDMPSRHACAVA